MIKIKEVWNSIDKDIRLPIVVIFPISLFPFVLCGYVALLNQWYQLVKPLLPTTLQ